MDTVADNGVDKWKCSAL